MGTVSCELIKMVPISVLAAEGMMILIILQMAWMRLLRRGLQFSKLVPGGDALLRKCTPPAQLRACGAER